MKKHNIIKVVLITTLVMLLLTWILPAASFSSEYASEGRLQMGLSQLFNYPIESFYYFGRFAIFIILVGGFYGILYKIPAYRTFLDKTVKLFEGKEFLFIALVSVLLAFGVSFAGLQLAYVIFIPYIISVILLMGYDKIVASLTVVGSLAAGFIGLTYSTSNTSILTSNLKLDYDYQIGVRFVILLVAVILVLFNIYMYIKDHGKKVIKEAVKPKEAKKEEVVAKVETKKTTSTSSKAKTTKTQTKKKTGSKSKNANKAALKDEDVIVVKEVAESADECLVPNKVTGKHKVWPFVVLFVLMLVLMFMAFINWGEGGFGLKTFENITKDVMDYKIFKFAIFAKIYGEVGAFGTWSVLELVLPLALIALLLVVIYNVKFDDMLDGFMDGAKKALGPAVIFVLLYTILVITTYHPFQMTLYHFILGSGSSLNIVTTMLVTLLAAIFNVDPMYAFQAVLPYYASVVTKVDNYSLVGIISQSMYGLSVLFAPTSFILLCVLSYVKVNYGTWLKSIWKLLLELFVILLIIFIILAII